MPGGHPARAQRQGEGDHGGQGLRNRGDDEADRSDHHQLHRLAPGEAHRQHDRAQHDRGHRQRATDADEAALQRRQRRAGGHQRGDPPHRAGHAGRGHHGRAPAVHDHRPG